MAAIAPEGTSWARELTALSREIATETHGAVEMKWYLGGIAGDELQALDRIRRGQLDGEAGASFCERLAPALRVTRVPGLFQEWSESHYVLQRLRSVYDAQFQKSGFIALGVGGFGNEVIFSRRPVSRLADLTRGHYWIWSDDRLWVELVPKIGITTLPLPIDEAERAYDAGRVDGFLAAPTAALAFQWSAHARYFSELPVAFLPACMVLSERSFDALPVETQQIIRAAAAKFFVRFEDLSHTLDRQLLGGLFEKQGLKRVPVSSTFRQEFFEAAQRAREQIAPELLPQKVLTQVIGWLADYRAEHDQPR